MRRSPSHRAFYFQFIYLFIFFFYTKLGEEFRPCAPWSCAPPLASISPCLSVFARKMKTRIAPRFTGADGNSFHLLSYRARVEGEIHAFFGGRRRIYEHPRRSGRGVGVAEARSGTARCGASLLPSDIVVAAGLKITQQPPPPPHPPTHQPTYLPPPPSCTVA